MIDKVNNILVGPDLHLPVPKINVGKFIYDKLIERKRHDIAFKNDGTDDEVTVAKILEDSIQLARILRDFGMTSKNVIALCADNHVNYPAIVLAGLYIGVPLALMNPAYTSYEMEQLFSIVNPDIVFCSNVNIETVKGVPLVKDKRIIAVDDSDYDDVKTLDDILKHTNPRSDHKFEDVNPNEHLAFVLFSSGTTGLPKAVMMNHFSIASTLVALHHPDFQSDEEPEVFLGVLPFFHIYGLYQILNSIYRQKTMMMLEHFNPLDYLRCIEKYKIDIIGGVPPLLQFLAKSPIVDEFDLSSLKEVTCGSAPVSENILEDVKKRLKLQRIRQLYGSTEAHMAITASPDKNNKPASVGLVCPGTCISIRDVETGKYLPANKEGEVCVKSAMMMKGYYKNDKATKESFTEDGWLRTGDMGYYDEDGFVYLVDRLKELIKYKAFQVAPAELEAVLLKNSKIADAGVVGRPDPRVGELPTAFVVKQEGEELTEEEVKSFVGRYLNKNKQLYGGVYFIEEIPRTRSGKIVRRELKKMLETMTKSKL